LFLMNERRIVETIRKLVKPGRRLPLGIGDDCAIYRPKLNEDLLFTTDQFIEGVHFNPGLAASAVGERALARSLSDIAAMGGTPRFCLVSLTVSGRETDQWILAFFRGLLKLARKTGTALAGGDMARAETIHCDVMVCGSTPKGKALRRDGAKPGDSLWVSGTLGKPYDRKIQPRLELGSKLLGRAHSCIDVSDGLALDLHRMCVASNVAAELENVPVARGSTLEQALHGGDDYELLFTLPATATGPQGAARIGTIVKGRPGTLSLHGEPLEPKGYDHFSPEPCPTTPSQSRLP
jgi:thiamine-monophosphate kinase